MHFDIQEYTFVNGLHLYYVQTPSDDIGVIANVNAGSLFETDENAGISHLVEHMLFKGTEKRPEAKDIWDTISLFGDIGFNAFTGQTTVSIETKIIKEDFKSALELFSDMLYFSKIGPEELEKEKEVIIDEMRVWEDRPNVYLFDKFHTILFDGTVLARPIDGFVDTVSSFSQEQVYGFYKDLFNPTNTTLFVVGPKDLEEVIENIGDYFVHPLGSGLHHILPVIKDFKNKKQEVFIEKKLSNTYLTMARILDLENKSDAFPMIVLEHLLDKALADKIRDQEALSYSVSSYYSSDIYSNVFGAYASCDPSNYSKVRELIFKEIDRFAQGDISNKNVNDAKESIKKTLILAGGTTMAKAKLIYRFWSKEDIYGINSYLDNLKSVSLDQVREAAAKYLRLDDMTTLGIGRKEKKSFWKKLFLRN